MKRLTNEEVKARVLEGMKLAWKKMIEEKKKNDANLIIYDKGKIIKLKARDIKI